MFEIQAVAPALRHLNRGVSDEERLAQIRALEELKCAATAAQMRIAIDFENSQRRTPQPLNSTLLISSTAGAVEPVRPVP